MTTCTCSELPIGLSPYKRPAPRRGTTASTDHAVAGGSRTLRAKSAVFIFFLCETVAFWGTDSVCPVHA